MRTYAVRVAANITFDFEIIAKSGLEAKSRIQEQYLKYVEGGDIKERGITIKTLPGDQVTEVFVMDTEVEDCNVI